MAEKISEDRKFCVDCGAEIHMRAEICRSCGIRQPSAIPEIEEVSNWWYLVPLIFGLVGGVLGWFGVKNRNPQKARYLLITGVITTVIVWLVLLS